MSEKGTNQYYITRQDSTESNARSYPRKFPFALAKAKGSWVEDVEGNKYLDFLCGAGTLALGHNDDEVNQAMVEMLTSDAPLHTLDLTTPVKDAFVDTVLSLLPLELKDNAKIQFCSPSGTDATDAAIKLCKTATGRTGVIAFQGGYHGMGHGALACTGNLNAKNKVNGLMPEVLKPFSEKALRTRCSCTLRAAVSVSVQRPQGRICTSGESHRSISSPII